MEKWYQKLKRGDVWWVALSSEHGDGISGSSVERKSRPYLIVSNDIGNKNAPVVTTVPITTRDSDDYPMHVYFRNEEQSRNQVILCEQLVTLSVKLFDKHQSYFMYSLDAELMDKVDRALSIQLGLNVKPVELQDLERLVNALTEAKLEELKKQAAVQESLRSLVDKTVEKFQNAFPVEDEPPLPALPPNIRLRKKGDEWTVSLMESYVYDVDKLSKEMICLKYDLKPLSVMPTYRNFKRRLAELKVTD